MFGTRKLKINNRVFYQSILNNSTYIYNTKGHVVFLYSSIYNLCSINIIQRFSISSEISKADAKLIPTIFTAMFGNKTLISIQNRTKLGYNDLIKVGFIDYARFPGNYVNSATANSDNCMSILIKTNKKLDNSIKTSLNILKNLADGETLLKT